MAHTNINNTAKSRRNQLKSVMDNFCTFSWGDEDMFMEYGAFIVGGKDALKFYNGPGFSNEYAQPQFNKAAGQLQGVNFTTQQISFTMGVYWITEEDYRKLIYLLNPLRVDFLTFGFETKYGYQAKLSKLGDSTRYVVGRSEQGEPVYYTEIPLTFEVQGAQCAIAQDEFEWNEPVQTGEENKYQINRNNNDDAPENSDLPFPIEFSSSIKFKEGGEHEVKLVAEYNWKVDEEDGNTVQHKSEVTLFDLKMQNTTQNSTIGIKYKSDLGAMFLQYGNRIDKIISLVSYTDTGDLIVKSIDCNKFEIPGQLANPTFDMNSFKFYLYLAVDKIEASDIKITARARTNVI